MQFPEEINEIRTLSAEFSMPYIKIDDLDIIQNLEETFNPEGIMPKLVILQAIKG